MNGKRFIGNNVLAVVMVLFLFSGCSLQKQRYSSGFHIEFAVKPPVNRHVTIAQKKIEVHSCAQKNRFLRLDSGELERELDTSVSQDALLEKAIDSLPEMNFSHQMLMQGKGGSKALGPAVLKGIKNRRIVTVHTSGKSICGRLVGVNPNGVFIVNHFRELVGFERTEYGKSQDLIYRQVYFVPFNEIDDIHLGGTLFYKVEKIVEPVFQYLAVLLILAGAVLSVLIWAWTGASSANGSEIIIGFLIVVGTIVAAILAGLVAISLLLVTAPFHLLGSRLPGRYWAIGKSESKGKRFISDLIRGKSRYRVF